MREECVCVHTHSEVSDTDVRLCHFISNSSAVFLFEAQIATCSENNSDCLFSLNTRDSYPNVQQFAFSCKNKSHQQSPLKHQKSTINRFLWKGFLVLCVNWNFPLTIQVQYVTATRRVRYFMFGRCHQTQLKNTTFN